jgi:hypothetical protein
MVKLLIASMRHVITIDKVLDQSAVVIDNSIPYFSIDIKFVVIT